MIPRSLRVIAAWTNNPSDKTSIFGRYSVDPFNVTDPQELGAAGGGTFDGGQPGAALGLIQNVGLGASHVITSNLVVDADFGYTRQRTGAQSAVDLAAGDFGSNPLPNGLGIPGTNGPGVNYEGQPIFAFSGGQQFSSLGNSNTGNPFLFRDNQYTGDINVSWNIGKHATKYGADYYHFALNHFQPSAGSGINNPRGGFVFQGYMTTNSTSGATNYNSLADMLLGLPNSGSAPLALCSTAGASASKHQRPSSSPRVCGRFWLQTFFNPDMMVGKLWPTLQ